MLHMAFAWGSLLLCCAYAFLFGGAPERWVAAIQLASVLGTECLLSPMATRYQHLETANALIDALTYLAFLLIASHANRWWTMWLCALQGMQVGAHLVPLLGLPLINMTYALMSQWLIYPMLVVQAIGTLRHRDRLQGEGIDQAWSRPWPKPPRSLTGGRRDRS